MNYTVTLSITTTDESDEHLANTQAIESEIRSWLESLKADVTAVTVEQTP